MALDGSHPVGEAGHNADHELIDQRLNALPTDLTSLVTADQAGAKLVFSTTRDPATLQAGEVLVTEAQDLMTLPATAPAARQLVTIEPDGSQGAVAASTFTGGTVSAEAVRTADATAMTAWRAARGARDLSPARALFIGDSRTEGEGATTLARRWQNRLADILRERYPLQSATPKYSPANYYPVRYVSPTLANLTPWTGTPTSSPNNLGLGTRVVTLAAGATLTLTLSGAFAATSAKIAYVQTSAASSFSYALDGGTATTVNSGGGLVDGRTIALNGLGGTAHTVVVTGVTGTVYIAGVFVYNGEEAAGLQFFDGGHHGIRSGTAMQGGATAYTATVASVDPHLVMVAIGTNDYGGNIDPESYRTSMTALLNAIVAGCTLPPTIVIVIDPPRGGTFTYPWASYVQVMRDLQAVDPAHRTILDLNARMPALSDNTYSLYRTDTIHEADRGHAFRADVLADYLSLA